MNFKPSNIIEVKKLCKSYNGSTAVDGIDLSIIEGSSAWVQSFAKALPLTHFLSAARQIINDGAGLAQVSNEIVIMSVMSLVFLSIGSIFFSWTK